MKNTLNRFVQIMKSNLLSFIWLAFFFSGIFFAEANSLESNHFKQLYSIEQSEVHDHLAVVRKSSEHSDLPFHSETLPEETNDTDEEESNESVNEEKRNYQKDCLIKTSFDFSLSTNKAQLEQLEQSIQSRSIRPLFLLFHCWKNHLS